MKFLRGCLGLEVKSMKYKEEVKIKVMHSFTFILTDHSDYPQKMGCERLQYILSLRSEEFVLVAAVALEKCGWADIEELDLHVLVCYCM